MMTHFVHVNRPDVFQGLMMMMMMMMMTAINPLHTCKADDFFLNYHLPPLYCELAGFVKQSLG